METTRTPERPSLLASLLRPLGPAARWSADEEAAYWEEQRSTVLTYGRMLLLVVVVLDFLWLPPDLPLRGDATTLRALAISRGWAGLSTLLLYAVMPHLQTMRRLPVLWATIQVTSVAFVLGFEFGGVRAPATPWFSYTPYILLAPVTLPFRMRMRIVAALVVAFALALGFFVVHPENLSDLRVGTAVLFVLGVLCFSILSGVFTDGMRRRIFGLQRATERQSVQLRDLNEHLESRVQEQTAEVRRLASHLEGARESERAHIARELHDELGQDLAALRYALKFARIRYAQDTTAVGSYFDDLEGLLERTTTTTRAILTSLRPSIVDDLGLCAAAEWMAKRLRERTGLDCRLEMPPEDLKLPQAIATTAFRILQEAMTNVARHAQAKHLVVELRMASSALDLVVRDDGIGFAHEPLGGMAGMGLIGMRERVLAIGGTLEIDSKVNEGTRIHVRLPVSDEGVAA